MGRSFGARHRRRDRRRDRGTGWSHSQRRRAGRGPRRPAAARAFPGWAATPVAERARWLERIKEGLASRAEEIATTISAEVGSPIAKARRAPECAIDPPAACSSHATMVASEGVPVHKSGFGLLLAFASCSAVYFSWASSLARIAAFSEIQCRTGAYRVNE